LFIFRLTVHGRRQIGVPDAQRSMRVL